MGTDKGVKLDKDKPRMGLVLGGFADALLEVGRVGTFGAEKYTDNGWHSIENGEERYIDALFRHLLSYKLGEEFDRESHLRHLSHVAWNALAILSLHLRDSIATVSGEPTGLARYGSPPEAGSIIEVDNRWYNPKGL